MDTVYELDKSQEEWLERIVSKELGGSREREENFTNSSILLTPVEENGDVDADLTALSDLMSCDISISQQPEDCRKSKAPSTDTSPAHQISAATQQGDGEEEREGEIRLRCRYCRFTACSVKDVEDHVQRHVRRGSIRYCPFCEYASASKVMLTEHIAWHTNSKPFKCRYCSYRNRLCSEVYYHQAKHKAEKKYKCRLCNFRTKWRKNISHHHMFVHTQTRPFKCDVCNMAFKRAYDLKFHKFRHNDVKPFCCEECQFRCKTKFELHMHKLKHSDRRYFACTFPGCTQWTKTKSDLTKHMKVHKEVRDFICVLCGKGFKCKGDLARHLERHTTERRFTCGTCLKAFKTRGTLRAHMAGHSGARPYVCTICGFRFRSKNNMKSHFKTHQGNRPYRCPICPYWAKQFYDLLAHIGVAHGNKYTYYCELCRKPFARLGQLKKHFGCEHPGIDPLRNPSVKTEEGEEETGQATTVAMVEVDGRPGYTIKGETFSESDNWRDYVVKREESQNDGENGWGQLILPVEAGAGQQDQGGRTVQLGDLVKRDAIEPISVIATYGECRLPLATQGFEFNLNKTGKKPKKWFMQPEHMRPADAQRQRRYLIRRERETVKRQGGIVRVAQKQKTSRKPALRKRSQRSALDKLWREKNPTGFEISQRGKSIVHSLRREVGLGRGRRKPGVMARTLSCTKGAVKSGPGGPGEAETRSGSPGGAKTKSGSPTGAKPKEARGMQTRSGSPGGAKPKEVSGAASTCCSGKRSRADTAPAVLKPRKRLATKASRDSTGVETRAGSRSGPRGSPSRPAINNQGRDLGPKTLGPRPRGRPRKRPATSVSQAGPEQKRRRLTNNTGDDCCDSTAGDSPQASEASVAVECLGSDESGDPEQRLPRFPPGTAVSLPLPLHPPDKRGPRRPRMTPICLFTSVESRPAHSRNLKKRKPRKPRKNVEFPEITICTSSFSSENGNKSDGQLTMQTEELPAMDQSEKEGNTKRGPGQSMKRRRRPSTGVESSELSQSVSLGKRKPGRPRKNVEIPQTTTINTLTSSSENVSESVGELTRQTEELTTQTEELPAMDQSDKKEGNTKRGPGQPRKRHRRPSTGLESSELSQSSNLGKRKPGRLRKRVETPQTTKGSSSPSSSEIAGNSAGCPPTLTVTPPVSEKGRSSRKSPAAQAEKERAGKPSKRLLPSSSATSSSAKKGGRPKRGLEPTTHLVKGDRAGCLRQQEPATLPDQQGATRREFRRILRPSCSMKGKGEAGTEGRVVYGRPSRILRPGRRVSYNLNRKYSQRKTGAGGDSHRVSSAEAERSPGGSGSTKAEIPRKELKGATRSSTSCRARRRLFALSCQIKTCVNNSVKRLRKKEVNQRRVMPGFGTYGKLGPAFHVPVRQWLESKGVDVEAARRTGAVISMDADVVVEIAPQEEWLGMRWTEELPAMDQSASMRTVEGEVEGGRPGNTSPPSASRACDLDDQGDLEVKGDLMISGDLEVKVEPGCSQGYGGLSNSDQSTRDGATESPGFISDIQALQDAYLWGARVPTPCLGQDEGHPINVEDSAEEEDASTTGTEVTF